MPDCASLVALDPQMPLIHILFTAPLLHTPAPHHQNLIVM